MDSKKITFKYVLIVVTAVIFTWVLHEFGHWLTYTFLGYDYIMTLNKVSYLSGLKPTNTHQIIAGAAGPLVTIIQAIIVCLFLELKEWNMNLYPFLFTAFYMRLLAGLMNFINPNDEGAISLHFGIGLFTISIIVSCFLFYMVYQVSKKYALNWKFQLRTTLIVMITSSFLILFDQFVGLRIL